MHHPGLRCIKQSFCTLTFISSNIKHRSLSARSAEFITSSCSDCRIKFSPCCDIQLQPWDLQGLCEIIGLYSIFIKLTQEKKWFRIFFFLITVFTSFISPLLLCCLCLPAQHFSNIMAHFSKNSVGSTLNVTARCVDLLTMDTEVVIRTLQWSVSWTVLGLDCFFHIWRWKPDEVLGGVINRAAGKTKSAKMSYSSLYFHSCKLWVVECFLAQS